MTISEPNDATLRAAYAKLHRARGETAHTELLPLERVRDLADGTVSGQARLDLLDRVLADPVMRDEYHLLRAVVEGQQSAGIARPHRRRSMGGWMAAAASLFVVGSLSVVMRSNTDVPAEEPFRGTDSAVTLVSPGTGAALTGNTLFEWRPVARALSYELLILDAAGEPVLRQQTPDTAAAIPARLPARGQWIVTARLSDGTTERSAARPFFSGR
jgi:hypothetical protein